MKKTKLSYITRYDISKLTFTVGIAVYERQAPLNVRGPSRGSISRAVNALYAADDEGAGNNSRVFPLKIFIVPRIPFFTRSGARRARNAAAYTWPDCMNVCVCLVRRNYTGTEVTRVCYNCTLARGAAPTDCTHTQRDCSDVCVNYPRERETRGGPRVHKNTKRNPSTTTTTRPHNTRCGVVCV